MKNNLLLIIFLATVIPTIIVYWEHAIVEFKAYNESITDNKNIKATKQLGEGIFFLLVTIGYFNTTMFIILAPKYRIPYIILLVGTVAVVILYYMRIYGIPIPGTEIVITDLSTDWRDVITKICQQIMVIPVSMMLVLSRKRDISTTS